MRCLHCDVLILGAGLSGLRAAWAAGEYAPALSVRVVTGPSAPSGSSFANRNNALGMQVLRSNEEQATFIEEVTDLAGPGFVDKRLITVLAEESEARYLELEQLGLEFRKDESGSIVRFTGCGSPHARAAVYGDLNHAFNQFRAKTDHYKVDISTGVIIIGLIVEAGTCRGAWGIDAKGAVVEFRSHAVIMALGGPAPLYAHRVCGPGNPGFSFGLLREAGARMANGSFLQFMWHDSQGQFRNLSQILGANTIIVGQDGCRITPDLREDILAARAGHCPAFYAHEDETADELLLAHRWDDGWCRVEQQGEVIMLGLMAHAGNGGAVVNEHGETSVRGLYAVGECATGMHGANRMGGAMVLATQVFGRRAGIAAAKWGQENIRAVEANAPAPETIPLHDDQHRIDMEIIRAGMDRHALFGPRSGLVVFRKELAGIEMSADDRRTILAARSALAVIDHALTFRN